MSAFRDDSTPPAPNRPNGDPLANYSLTPEQLAESRKRITERFGEPVGTQSPAPQPGATQVPPQAWQPQAPQQPAVWPPPPGGDHDALFAIAASGGPYASPFGLSRVVIGLFAAVIGVFWVQYAVETSTTLTFSMLIGLAVVMIVGGLSSQIGLMLLTHRLYSNLSAFRALGLSTTTAMAPWWWIIPVMSLWKPYLVFQDIWQASDPQLQNDQNPYAWKMAPPSALIKVWWLLWVIEVILAAVLGFTGLPKATVGLVQALSESVAYGVAIAVVNAVAVRQEEKYSLIEQARASLGVPYMPSGQF